ncbi:MAG: alpha/beta hydrolase [Simkaniaceae bacterium]|nr:alpha/beta hydrolase [Candidatus Sacchlamyda saccharinae]
MASILQALFIAMVLPFVSDRMDFENPDRINQATEHALVDLSSGERSAISHSELLKRASEKNILILVHGYNNTYSSTLSSYMAYAEHLEDSYDLIVGYIWPGGDHDLDYFSAKDRAVSELDLRFLSTLTLLSRVANNVDLYAHSMGCRLSLEAISQAPGKVVRNLFLTAPAVDDEALEKGEKYHAATKNCDLTVVFYSEYDKVLKKHYPLAEWDQALGYKGFENLSSIPLNVFQIDSTDDVSHHSDYKNEESIFGHIRELL